MKNATKIIVSIILITAFLLTALPAAPAHAADTYQEEEPNSFCENPGSQHPVAAAIAENYETTYEQVLDWFCGIDNSEGDSAENQTHGLGQIMLALQTAVSMGEEHDPADFLAQRQDGKGWGQIWQEAGLIGKDRNKENGKPDHAGPPEGNGKPDHAGPKDKVKDK